MLGENWNWSDFNTLFVSGLGVAVGGAVGGIVAYYIYTRFKVYAKQKKAKHDANISIFMINQAINLTTSAGVRQLAIHTSPPPPPSPPPPQMAQSQLNANVSVLGNLNTARGHAQKSRNEADQICKSDLESFVDPRAKRARESKDKAIYSMCKAMEHIPSMFLFLDNAFVMAQNQGQAQAQTNALAGFVATAVRDNLDDREIEGMTVLGCIVKFATAMGVLDIAQMPGQLPQAGETDIALVALPNNI